MIVAAATLRMHRLAGHLEIDVGRVAERLAGITMDISGVEYVDPSTQYVVLPLHEGFADALALLHLPLPLKFAARDELFDWPGLGPYLQATGHLRVATQTTVASLRNLYRDGERVFDEGNSLVVFPQGTVLGIEILFQPGALRLAKHFARPVLPVVLTGSHRVWEHPFSSRLRFGQRISMRVLEPIDPQQFADAEFRSLEKQMKSIALSDDVAPVRRYNPDRDGWWDGYRFEIDPAFRQLKHRVDEHRSTASSPDR
jgi:1-acyl-sn-glycerol-3-phosphate acyltransferase